MINILYFASLREQLDIAQEQLELDAGMHTVRALKENLAQRGQLWSHQFSENSDVLVSVNQQMAADDSAIQDGDEVAFFPPVTGG
jgi:molybdopterin synthase sulfur carrier subunit